MPPRSGLERSDFVPWPLAANAQTSGERSLSGVKRKKAKCAGNGADNPKAEVEAA
jgi:hypothetical protein